MDERHQIGLACDPGLGKDAAQMRPRRGLGDRERFRRFGESCAGRKALEHASLCRRQLEVRGQRPAGHFAMGRGKSRPTAFDSILWTTIISTGVIVASIALGVSVDPATVIFLSP